MDVVRNPGHADAAEANAADVEAVVKVGSQLVEELGAAGRSFELNKDNNPAMSLKPESESAQDIVPSLASMAGRMRNPVAVLYALAIVQTVYQAKVRKDESGVAAEGNLILSSAVVPGFSSIVSIANKGPLSPSPSPKDHTIALRSTGFASFELDQLTYTKWDPSTGTF